ncbi:hypothetical protein FHY13_003124 [Xanthomonas arboricola]|uniref:Shedu immune nuclease family protein n=1 Tax=Xanthomonas euroxanthea TaxID=2259622 RepID=UPI00161E88AF|nr:Shedu immune nuclease family protein [Xanthomonas euroxanthea]MBB3814753.1 hypothetical protein [Xanthomonas euroxanthea]
MDDDSYQFPKPRKVYVSPSLPGFGDKTKRVRIASKVSGASDGYEYAKEHGEVVLRDKPNARTSIKAKFVEATGDVFILTIQKFDNDSGMPYGAGFTFVGEEIPRLLEFVTNIRAAAFEESRSLNLTDDELRRRVLTPAQAGALLAGNPEVFAEAVRQAVTKEDLVSLGYRRQQLETFERLLSDADYFEHAKAVKRCGDEALWQQFFEKNSWIFGYGLQYVYGAGLDGEKLEQYVRGHTVLQPGKRVDGLLKSKAIASTLCFVEIKHHRTGLMAKQQYRGGCYAPSAELCGAVAQIQGTVSYASESLFGRHRITGEDGFPTGEEVFNFSPRSFVIAGSLGEFRNEHGVSEDRLRSFELYRAHLHQPEIFTFDEIFERARHIVAGHHAPLAQE